MMLEHRVKSDHDNLVGREDIGNALGLRNAGLNAARTQHLEGVEHDHAPALPCERQRRGDIEPLHHVQLGGRGHGGNLMDSRT